MEHSNFSDITRKATCLLYHSMKIYHFMEGHGDEVSIQNGLKAPSQIRRVGQCVIP